MTCGRGPRPRDCAARARAARLCALLNTQPCSTCNKARRGPPAIMASCHYQRQVDVGGPTVRSGTCTGGVSSARHDGATRTGTCYWGGCHLVYRHSRSALAGAEGRLALPGSSSPTYCGPERGEARPL
eukprot:scaffold1534_cov391-Prasinococcus_capsulatus_cf.AAC.8